MYFFENFSPLFFQEIYTHVRNKNLIYGKPKIYFRGFDYEKNDENLLVYLCYWNEKYYRNGFMEGVKTILGCLKE